MSKSNKLKISTIKNIDEVAFELIELYDGTKFVLLPENWRTSHTFFAGKNRYILMEHGKQK